MAYKTGFWSQDEVQILKDNVELSVKELSELLNRSEGSIRGKKTALGIQSGKFKPFTDIEKQIIKDYYMKNPDAIDLDVLSKKINRQKTSICRYANKIGISNNSRPMTEEKLKNYKEKLSDYYNSDYFKNVVRKKLSETAKKTMGNSETHPRGMLGKHHTDETKRKMSKSHIELAANMSKEEKSIRARKSLETKIKNNIITSTSENSYSRTKSGKRKDLNNQFFRSSWESNIARLLNYNYIEWKYEFKRFYFDESVNGVASYQPDFYLPEFDKWIEVKGWMDEKSKIRLQLFKDQYPEEFSKLILIDEDFYNELRDEISPFIDNWEYSNQEKKMVCIRDLTTEST